MWRYFWAMISPNQLEIPSAFFYPMILWMYISFYCIQNHFPATSSHPSVYFAFHSMSILVIHFDCNETIRKSTWKNLYYDHTAHFQLHHDFVDINLKKVFFLPKISRIFPLFFLESNLLRWKNGWQTSLLGKNYSFVLQECHSGRSVPLKARASVANIVVWMHPKK